MTETVLKIETLGKKYRLGMIGSSTLYQDINNWWNKLIGKKVSNSFIIEEGNNLDSSKSDYVWALKDINVEIKKGEVIGVIGRNGAGKSTLLKLLSKVTAPSEGKISFNGKIASLLEVGTGFHPELTGRENIFLNGAILGMSKKEITLKLDEIIEFSGISKYIDTPVKRYSSGMYVRLAFSVAAHLDADILVIDEVLAVGDTIFQKKCVDKMLDIAKRGRTVLFVSHNMASVKAICSRALLLSQGRIIFEGNVETAIEKYNSQNHKISNLPIGEMFRDKYGKLLRFETFSFEPQIIKSGDPIRFKFQLKALTIKHNFSTLDFGFNISDTSHVCLIHISNRFIKKEFAYKNKEVEYTVEIENTLKPGIFYLSLFVADDSRVYDWLNQAIQFEIEDGNPYNFENTQNIQGLVLPAFDIKENL